MRRIRQHLTYANVMATLAVFLVLGGGTAIAAFVVDSNSDVAPGTISGHKPPRGQHANVIGGSINGRDVADKSLTGADLAPSALSKAKAKTRVFCNPDDPQFVRCGQVSINLTRAARVLVVVTGEWSVQGTEAQGECELTRDHFAFGGGAHPGMAARAAPGIINTGSLALSDVVGPLIGRHTLGIKCRELVGNIVIGPITVSAVALGPA